MTKALLASQLPAAMPLIERRIYVIRGQKVMLASDLAEIYQVPTKALNQAVKRNPARFPEDFMFRLSDAELQSRGEDGDTPATLRLHRTRRGHALRRSQQRAHNKDLARRIEQIEAGQNRRSSAANIAFSTFAYSLRAPLFLAADERR